MILSNYKKYVLMIESFRHKGLEDFHYDATKKGIQPKHANKLADILDVLDASTIPQNLNFPGSGLHRLHPQKENRWAVKVSGNWRITFRFEDGDVYEVDYEDYH
ncbi:MAG: type II toxin-antitoxin system RelE/ParE family toxin [Chloroflexota bacterium]